MKQTALLGFKKSGQTVRKHHTETRDQVWKKLESVRTSLLLPLKKASITTTPKAGKDQEKAELQINNQHSLWSLSNYTELLVQHRLANMQKTKKQVKKWPKNAL